MNTKPSGLTVKLHDDYIILTLNRPENANALSPALVEDMIGVFTSTRDIRLCILQAEGKHFCAGFDLVDVEDLSDGDLLWRFLRIEKLLQLVHHAPFPVLAFAHGQVVGAGADLFAACWRRVASKRTNFRMPGWNFELALGTRRLTRLIGQDAARDLLIDTKSLDAAKALKVNLATDIVESENWPAIITSSLVRARVLPKNALNQMLSLTNVDTRQEDIAAIVDTAGQPGLKDRVMNYRKQVIAENSSIIKLKRI